MKKGETNHFLQGHSWVLPWRRYSLCSNFPFIKTIACVTSYRVLMAPSASLGVTAPIPIPLQALLLPSRTCPSWLSSYELNYSLFGHIWNVLVRKPLKHTSPQHFHFWDWSSYCSRGCCSTRAISSAWAICTSVGPASFSGSIICTSTGLEWACIGSLIGSGFLFPCFLNSFIIISSLVHFII